MKSSASELGLRNSKSDLADICFFTAFVNKIQLVPRLSFSNCIFEFSMHSSFLSKINK